MTLAPLWSAAPAIQLHAIAAVGAFALGLVQLAGPKGTRLHRTLGWSWVAAMLAVAASSFWIHELRVWGPWSPIHLLSIVTLATLPLGVYAARRHRVRMHWQTMASLFFGGLLIAGAFTFLPGRLMHTLVTGG